jgi:flagellar P-ring protein precursor FlgI
MKILPTLFALLSLAPLALGQNVSKADRASFDRAQAQGTEVQISSIASFRGVVANQILGFGLITGLAGTGDTKRFLQTQKATINMLRAAGLDVDPSQSESKNVALVTLVAELPPFSTPGSRIDITVSTIGDCTSLRGGTLLFAPLRYPGKEETYATAAGSISVGGFSASSGGAGASKGFVTVGKIPGGAIVQRSVPTTIVFDGKMYIDLQEGNALTARRIEETINHQFPEFHAAAIGAATIQVDLPTGMSSNTAQAKLGALNVFADTEAKVIIDEKTGTIVIGGNVKIAPCAVAKGSLSVQITSDPFVSQPNPLSGGKTVVGDAKTVNVKEQTAEIAVIRPNTTVADLAAIFQALHLKADDIINILRALHDQGALKARLVVQ